MALVSEVLNGIMKSRSADPALELANAILEVGTFMPSILGSTSDGVGTYVFRTGQFLRFGRLIIAQYRIITSAHTGLGQTYIANLPFPATSDSASGYFSGAVYSSYQPISFGLVPPGSTSLYFYGPNPASASNIPAGDGDWLGSIVYWTD